MGADKVKLVIKAPNQNIDDQAVECSINWTVIELKTHLSEVYPSKPDVKDQKLIYSGRLLKDESQLKEVLRQNEHEASVFTVHLVCTRQNKTTPVLTNVSSESSQHESRSSSSQRSEYSLRGSSSSPGSSSESASNSDDGSDLSSLSGNTETSLSPSSVALNPVSYIQQQQQLMYAYYQQQTATNFTSVPPFDVASQMSAYQQAVLNYYTYMMQNAQQIPTTAAVDPMPVSSNVRQIDQPDAEQRNQGGQVPRPAPNRNIRMNAQGGPLMNDNDDGHNRDWLDYFYLCCRGFVLFSIVYFYSSPERLLLVIGLSFLAFLYQEGWLLARLRNNRVVENVPHRPQNQQNENQNNTDDSPPPNPNPGENDAEHLEEREIEAAMDGDNPPHVHSPNQTNQQNPAWTFISSFFSSLIPEPPPPVNIN